MSYDVTQWLTYRPEMMDPALPSGLWFCSDLLDVQAVDINAACLGLGCSWEDLKHCRDFLAQYKSIFVPVANEDRRGEIIQQLESYAPSTPILTPRDGAFHDRATVFYKDGTKISVDVITVLEGVLAGPCTMERVECGPGCGMLPELINALLDTKE